MFTTIEVLLEGSPELEENVHPTEAADRITYLIQHYSLFPGQVTIYTMSHDHPEDFDGCECIQWITDHSPIFRREGTHSWRQAQDRLTHLYENVWRTIDAGMENGAFTPSTDNPEVVDFAARNCRRVYWDMLSGTLALVASTRQLIRDIENHPSRRVTQPVPYEDWSNNRHHLPA